MGRAFKIPMPESRQVQIAKLREAVRQKRSRLEELKFVGRHPPKAMNEGIAAHISELEAELQQLENELHDLNVEQIRHELGQAK